MSSRERSESPIRMGTGPRILGVLGSRNITQYQEFVRDVMDPMIKEFNKKKDIQRAFSIEKMVQLPDLILCGSEGPVASLLQSWAERNDIEFRTVQPDWRLNPKRARAIRDSQIAKEASQFLLFRGPRSDYYEKMATKLKKKHEVFLYTGLKLATNDELDAVVE